MLADDDNDEEDDDNKETDDDVLEEGFLFANGLALFRRGIGKDSQPRISRMRDHQCNGQSPTYTILFSKLGVSVVSLLPLTVGTSMSSNVPVAEAVSIVNDPAVAAAVAVSMENQRTCRGCGILFTPGPGSNPNSRQGMRCAACNRNYVITHRFILLNVLCC